MAASSPQTGPGALPCCIPAKVYAAAYAATGNAPVAGEDYCEQPEKRTKKRRNLSISPFIYNGVVVYLNE